MKRILYFCTIVITAGLLRAAPPPNVVLIFCDDLGYGDIGCYGSKNPTPNIDGLAKQGMRFSEFYVAQAVCSASRAALMTGCYSNRVGIQGALGPGAQHGINPDEMTMAEMFKSRGYATGIFGKWHLGHEPPFHPYRHGFDEFIGLPYSNDMWPKHPSSTYPPLPLFDGEAVVESDPDQRKLTRLYTERAVAFIEKHRDKPFFAYVPHAMPHVPLHVSEEFKGKTGMGMYADVIAEIDWSVGQILDAVKRTGNEERTLVIFTSDNGPWLLYGDHAGSSGRLREGKGTTFEGGVRVPFIARLPGAIPAGSTCGEMAATIDLLPTFAALVGAEIPADRIIDGRSILPLLRAETGAASPHEAYLYYYGQRLEAVRSGQWKLIFPHDYVKPSPPGGGSKPGKYARPQIGLSLFDLKADPGESRNVVSEHPDVVKRLEAIADRAREDLGDSLRKQKGSNVRPPGELSPVGAQEPS